MTSSRLVLLAIALALPPAACGGAAPRAAPAPTARKPVGLPARIVASDFDALVANRVVTPLELESVARDELRVIDSPPRLIGRRLTMTGAMPGGWHEALYVDAQRRAWIVHRDTPMGHVPDGVIISATRVFSTTVELPADLTFAGVVTIVDDPADLARAAG